MTTLSTSTDWPVGAIPKNWIESLFDKMSMEYGKKFTDQWGGMDVDKLKKHWAERLGNLTGEELKTGFKALSTKPWPPTLPEFITLCRPPVDSMKAYYEAMSGIQARENGEVGVWSHPAIFWAMVKVSPYDLKKDSYSQIKGRWESELDFQMSKSEWEPIPKPMIALPPPKFSNEEAKKRLSEVGAESIVKKRVDDPRGWAKRILKRVQQGDKTVTSLQARFAKEAIGAKPP